MIMLDASALYATAAVIAAVAALVWACRKHPKNPGR